MASSPPSCATAPCLRASFAAGSYDVLFCARTFEKNFDDAKKAGTVVILLRNVMPAAEIEQALKDAGLL